MQTKRQKATPAEIHLRGVETVDFRGQGYTPLFIVKVLGESEKAVRLQVKTGFGELKIWLPKSEMIRDRDDGWYYVRRWLWKRVVNNK